MSNQAPEQNLINEFIEHMRNHADEDLCIEELYNSNCRSKTFADIEFSSKSKLRWAIEAKSDDSKDKYNTVHKIFGELLKETGRANRAKCRHGVLIPESAIGFYSRAFQSIDRDKFLGFGALIPIDTVFVSSPSGAKQITWEALYDAHQA